MYLSYLLIDIGDNPDRPRPGRLWVRNLYHVHQRLCMAFPSKDRKSKDSNFLKPFQPEDFGKNQVHVTREAGAGFLFRIDPQPGSRAVILVQSAIKPDWEYAFHNADYLLAAPPEVKLFDPDFTKGRNLRFRLMVNPTRKIDTKSGSDGQKRNGRRVPIRHDQLFDWLKKWAELAGFSVKEDSVNIQLGYIYIKKSREDNGHRMRSVRYEGILTVKDPDRFKEILARGMGSGKAFGFGLLSVANLKASSLQETS